MKKLCLIKYPLLRHFCFKSRFLYWKLNFEISITALFLYWMKKCSVALKVRMSTLDMPNVKPILLTIAKIWKLMSSLPPKTVHCRQEAIFRHCKIYRSWLLINKFGLHRPWMAFCCCWSYGATTSSWTANTTTWDWGGSTLCSTTRPRAQWCSTGKSWGET